MAKKGTMHDKWESASKEPGHGIRFHDAPDTGKRIPMKGFTDEDLKRILGEEEFMKMKMKESIDEIDDDTVDEIEEIEVAKYNHNHDARGRFSTAQGARSHDSFWHEHHAGEDVGDAAAQIKDPNRYNIGGKKNSLDGHIGSDGKLTPEREALHRKIIDQELAGKVPVEGQPTMTMLGGGPASGKSSVMSTNTADNPHAVTVDVDHFKYSLPGYSDLSTKDTRASDFYHEESSSLSKRFAEYAYQENLDVIYDGTGDGSLKSVQKKIDAAKKRGYKVEAKYVTIDTDEAVRRNQKRYEDGKKAFESGKSDKPPRLVDEDVVRKTHAKCTDISVAMAPKFDHIEIWDNNGAKGQQKKIAEGGNGKYLKAVPGQEEAFRRYLSKGTKGINGFITLPDGQVVPVE